MFCLSVLPWEQSKKEGVGTMLLPCSIDFCFQVTGVFRLPSSPHRLLWAVLTILKVEAFLEQTESWFRC